MGEKQERVWVVMRMDLQFGGIQSNKVFDDRKDARSYAERMATRSRKYDYWVEGVKKE